VYDPYCCPLTQIGDEARYLVEMMTNLQQIYGTDTGDLYTVFCPQKGRLSTVILTTDVFRGTPVKCVLSHCTVVNITFCSHTYLSFSETLL